MKTVRGILIILILCGVVWSAHPAKEQVKQMEEQLSDQYFFANFLLSDTVEKLLAWNYSKSLSDADEIYINELSDELLYTTNLIFSGSVVHLEWRNRIDEIQGYLNDYKHGSSLSEKAIEDLYQTLQATRFILMDLRSSTDETNLYDVMHDEQHEMVEKVKNRLATHY